jgi:hypothetical protein
MKKTMNKKIAFVSLFSFLALAASLIASQAEAKTKAYCSGDAITYRGSLIAGSTNMSGLEIFKLENGKLIRKAQIKSSDPDNFSAALFNEENGSLYAYAIDGRYFFKYDITDLSNPKLISKIKDGSWDWFRGLSKSGSKIVTVGSKGVKLWNTDLQVIDSFNITNDYGYNVRFDQSGKYIFSADKGVLKIFSTESRQIIAQTTYYINKVSKEHNRQILIDKNGYSYLADDKKLKKFDLSGKVVASYDYTSENGYDVDGNVNDNYLYLADGVGIVKIKKSDMKDVS